MQKLVFSFLIVVFVSSNIITVSGYILEIALRDLNKGHTVLGKNINLECVVKTTDDQIRLEWNSPLNLKLTANRTLISKKTEKVNSTFYLIRSNFTITKTKSDDESIYYCYVSNTKAISYAKYKYIWVPVYDTKKHVIKLDVSQTFFDVVNTELNVYMQVHPNPKFYWLDKFNRTISHNSEKIQIISETANTFANYKIVLKFNSFNDSDIGNYTLVVENQFGRKNFSFYLNVTGAPKTSINYEETDEDSLMIKCKAVSIPRANITWEFKSCGEISCILNEMRSPNILKENYSEYVEDYTEENGLEITSYITLNSSDAGRIICNSSNKLGQNFLAQYIYRTKSGMDIFEKDMSSVNNSIYLETLFHETIYIVCAVSLDTYYPDIYWYRKDRIYTLDDIRVPIKGFDEYYIKQYNAVYSSLSVLKVGIEKNADGEYYCRATTKNGTVVTKVITIIAKEQPLLNVATNMKTNKTILARYGSSFKFYCNVDGYPKPSITWFKDNDTVVQSEKVIIQDKNQTLALYDISPSDNGTYRCEVANRLQQKIIKTAIFGAIENDFNWLLVVIIVLIIILIISLTIITIKVRKDNKLKNELKAMGLANFEEGAIENINPEATLEDQAELLPYDRKFEIPPEFLKLGKELGSGAFGVVVKGELTGFPTKDAVTTVAVKTVNKFAGQRCIRALASELKIMVHLGKHINIVNLIGAYTKEITKKKLLVVVEFCRFGNLQEYILNNSTNFLDQRKHNRFDWTINMDLSGYYTKLLLPDSDPDIPKYISSQDLLYWAFQVSKGMEYLAGHKVLHGDLAARNVLLAENNVAKIADFGLSRSIYKDGIYKKSTNVPLPVKWMAVESIGESIFSTQSDIWSFGVFLWELFSLAKTPYPGLFIDQSFYKKLLNGYRMEIPDYATFDLYKIMLSCWDANPTQRPSFTTLAEQIGAMLEETVKNNYVDMSGNYVLMDTDSGKKKDYLKMMSSPNFGNQVPASPHYVNNITYFHENESISTVGKTD